MSSSSSSPCAACKFLRRKCTQGCVFAPYFPPDNPAKFSHVHRIFGASNVSKLLNDLTPAQREDAVNSLAYEAEARLHDPVYGCVGYISVLQHRLFMLRHELFVAKKELSAIIGGASAGAFAPNHQFHAGAGIGFGLGSQQMTYRDQNQYDQQEQQQQMVNVQQLAEAVAAAREQEMRETERLIAEGGGVVPQASSSLTMVVAPQQHHNLHHNHHHHHQIGGGHEGRSGEGPSS
ncbi:LOB domain-containing protein 36 [Platanthera guangdongensis]|uniref:LOB domain-containing protein 36 n=1 Tax=Platanthera guangdongensis TaxID=2320717 RepID=A0ABR2N132_9ASPA